MFGRVTIRLGIGPHSSYWIIRSGNEDVFTSMILASAGISCHLVCPSVTSRCYTEMAKRRIE